MPFSVSLNINTMFDKKSILPILTILNLKIEARDFALHESNHPDPSLFGVTDGKAVGTYFEHKFQDYLHTKYRYNMGSSANGLDFPELEVDMKTTSIRQPQSSCPFKSARQKIYGLGYNLLVFVYDKIDDHATRTGCLNILHTIFIDRTRTADFQTTSGLLRIIQNEGNQDDIVGFFSERIKWTPLSRHENIKFQVDYCLVYVE